MDLPPDRNALDPTAEQQQDPRFLMEIESRDAETRSATKTRSATGEVESKFLRHGVPAHEATRYASNLPPHDDRRRLAIVASRDAIGRTTPRKTLVRVFAIALVAYGVVCVIARLGYRFVLYPAPGDPAPTIPVGGALLSLRADDGAPVRALQLSAPVSHRTIVVFHGNGETIASGTSLAQKLHSRGFGVVLAQYRGYGVSKGAGVPSEQDLYRDAIAVLDELNAQGSGRDRIVLMGTSLGTGVAAEMARRERGAVLILVSPYTSIAAMARRAVPFLPRAWLCPDKFDTLAKASDIHVPTLVVHGDADEVIPVAMGRAVAAAILGARLEIIVGGHHSDLFAQGDNAVVEAIASFAHG